MSSAPESTARPADAAPPRGLAPWQRAVCYSFLLLGLAFALVSAAKRIEADQDYNEVMVLVDWQGLSGLPEQESSRGLFLRDEEREVRWRLLERIPGAMLCYGEETVAQLVNENVLKPAAYRGEAPTYVVTDKRLIDDFAAGCSRHGYAFDFASDGSMLIQFPELGLEALNNLPVCWRSDFIDQARERGVPIVLRPDGSEYLGPGGLEGTLGFCQQQPLVLFQGNAMLGYPGRLDDTIKMLRAQKQLFGWVEFDEQDGGDVLASKLAPWVVRVHSITAEEMEKYSVADAVQRFYRALSERNIRCIYLRPYVSGPLLNAADEEGGTSSASAGYRTRLFELNSRYFSSVQDMLVGGGYRVRDKIGPPRDAPQWLKSIRPLPFVLAKGAVFVLLIALLFPLLRRWVFSALLGLVVFKALLVLALPQLMSVFLLETAVIFPLWAFFGALSLYQRWVRERPAWCPRRWLAAMACLLLASLASAAGGLLIHAVLWDERMMLHIGQFRGVTLGLALPMLVLAAYAWQAESLQDAWDGARRGISEYWLRLSQLWQAPIRYGDVAFILIALGALGIVVLRSGNEGGLPILDFETMLRGSLEQALTVRPRTKELLGHPAFVLFLLSLPWRNRLSLLLGLAGMLGQVSILNTFCHIHTPLMVTVQRVCLGLLIGLISAALWGVIVQAAAWGMGKLKSRQHP
ncbi:hypothetical protein IT575_15400 [bacterium]|nr:hypothetical protein [bacterium]